MESYDGGSKNAEKKYILYFNTVSFQKTVPSATWLLRIEDSLKECALKELKEPFSFNQH